MGRWRAAGKYRWRRQPEGQYSLLYNLSPAALNYLAAAGAGGRALLERRTIEELVGIKARREISAIEDRTLGSVRSLDQVCRLLRLQSSSGATEGGQKKKNKPQNEITVEERLR